MATTLCRLTDAQWALVAPHIPSAKSGGVVGSVSSLVGRPRTTDVRTVPDAIIYLLRTGQRSIVFGLQRESNSRLVYECRHMRVDATARAYEPENPKVGGRDAMMTGRYT